MRRDFRASRSLYESQSRSMWQFRPGAGGVLMKALRYIMPYIRRNIHTYIHIIYIILCIYVNKIIPLSLSLSLSLSRSIYLSIHPNSLVQICTHSLYNGEIIFDLDHFDCWRKHLWRNPPMKKQCCEHIISSTHLRSTSLQLSQMPNAEKCLEQKRNLLTNMERTWDDLALLHVLWHGILKFGWNATHGPTSSIASYQFHCVFVTFINVYQRVNVWNPTTPQDTRLLRSVTPAKVSFTALSATISMFLSKERQHYCR